MSRDSVYINKGWHHLFTRSETRRVVNSTSANFRAVEMATDLERLASFEEAYYDQYDYYNLLEYPCHAGGKGRTKREIELNTNRHCPAGHERKIAEKFHNSEMKRRRTKSSSSWSRSVECVQVSCGTCRVACVLTRDGKASIFPRSWPVWGENILGKHRLPLVICTTKRSCSTPSSCLLPSLERDTCLMFLFNN